VQLEVPTPAAGELLLKIRAASVNPVDWKIREGKFPPVTREMLPYTLGRDVCGEVVAMGDEMHDEFAEGDPLYAFLGVDRGGYAEYVILKRGEAAAAPKSVDHTVAAAVPLAGLTAWQGLFTHGGLQEGQRVLVHAGSGGVGHFAIQFAKAKGAHVVTTVSGDNVDFVRKLGADVVIDHATHEFQESVSDMDVVLDLLGGETQETSWAVLRRGGILVSTVAEPAPEKAQAHGVRGIRYTAQPDAAQLRQIAAMIDAGDVRPFVSRTFALSEALDALKTVESGHTVGKVVLTMP
jgi:NADPH:quinone reductase-like Zn-dependent oxidoreductase